MDEKILEQINRIAKKLNYHGEVNSDNVKTIVEALAENFQDSFVGEIEYMYLTAVEQWEFYNSSKNETFLENYNTITDNADSILALLNVETDYPGLYPAFKINVDGKEYFEYSVLNTVRRFNHFWKTYN